MLTLILTGGASRRMGRDKAMLPFGSGTMLQTLIDRYGVLGPVAVSVDRPGRFSFRGAAELPDRFPGQGPINGIVSGFMDTGAESLLLTATDLPCGDPALAQALAALMGTADAAVLRRGAKGIEPLFAVYGRRCLDCALNCLENGKRSFFDLFSLVKVRLVLPEELPDFDLERILTNINTPEEYAKILSSRQEERLT